MKLKIEKKCPNCGKVFLTRDKGANTATYCCNECYKEHKGIGKLKKGTCAVCGNEFPLIHGKGTLVCSKECLGKYRSLIFSKPHTYTCTCKKCGKEFEVDNWRKDVNFCSKDCYWNYRNANKDEFEYINEKRKRDSREKRICEMCGKEFEVYKKVKKRFCSAECQHEYRRSEECKKKRNQTFLERFENGDYEETIKERSIKNSLHNLKKRQNKYLELCRKSDLTLIEYISNHVLKVKCNKCGKEFITNNLSYLPYEYIPCKQCGEEYKDYKPALKIYELLDNNGIEYVKNDRTVINPFEIDILIPNLNLGFEINGNFWHSEICGKDKKYHINKTIKANEKGIKLIHIYEDEIVNKWEIVESRILNLIHKNSQVIYARKCSIKEIDKSIKKDFLNKTHIQGDTNSSINLGLYHNDELVSVMTFGKERVIYKANSTDGNYELIRFASKLKTNIIGGFSKLLKHFIRNYNPKNVKTFCDIRWSGINFENTVYLKNGFTYTGTSKPNYWYMHKTQMYHRMHRYNFTKYSILQKNHDLDSKKTEWELMQELGYNRIWDCGNLKFEMNF